MRGVLVLLLIAVPAAAQPDEAALRAFAANGFRAETEDGRFAFHVGGRLEWDNAWFTQDANLRLGSGPPATLSDGTAMRRARLRADGTGYGFIDYVAEVNFANIQEIPNIDNEGIPVGSVGLADFFLTFRELPLGLNLRLGHFKAPLSLERYSSATYLPYMERSSVFDAFYGPNQRQSGAMLFGSWLDDRVTAAASATRVNTSTLNNFAFDARDGQYAAGARLTALPVDADEGRTVVLVGINGFHQALSDDRFAVANRMPLRGGAGRSQVPNVVATGSFSAPDGATLVSAESAFLCGPFSCSGEVAVSRATAVSRGDVTYWAGYVEAGCFVTAGDRRRLERKTATWGRVVPERDAEPRGGFGAVEVVTRVSYLDLVSGSPVLTPGDPSAGAQAGRQTDVTVGVNWYLNPQTFFLVNYVWTHVESVAPGATGSAQGIGVRMHYDF